MGGIFLQKHRHILLVIDKYIDIQLKDEEM